MQCMYMMEFYSAMKKDKILSFRATWLELEIIRLSKTEKDNFHIFLLTSRSLKVHFMEVESRIIITRGWGG